MDSYPECRFPSQRRGSVEAIGINVVATCARAGIELTFPVAGHPKVVSMLFLGCPQEISCGQYEGTGCVFNGGVHRAMPLSKRNDRHFSMIYVRFPLNG